ncbi:MAG TPA: hypothetical protein VK835_12895 [Bacteroidia bacterium]|nr:hypothetical protein [Bacteroidia bacterium]
MKKRVYLFVVYFFIVFTHFCGYSQSKNECLSRQYVILGAQLANQSYTFSKLAYFVPNKSLSEKNVDSAIIFIEQSITAIDSAIILATDSELMALDYANIAKKFAIRSHKLLKAYQQSTNTAKKLDFAKQAIFFSANASTDAYHASFYFKDCAVKEVKKDATTTPLAAKQPTKLDVDQNLFALLDEHLHQKTEEDKKEVSILEADLKTQKDPIKAAKIKAEIKKLEQDEAQLELKDKNAKTRLDSINAQIDRRDKNKATEIKPEETVFSKSMKRPADQWDKDVILDAELPMGLVYQVQIGFYKNLNVSEVFRGLTPIMGKTMPTGGVSYSIGMFEKIADAQQAKNYVRSIGLADAFVIASYDRKKITIAEAAKFEKK